MAAECPSGGAGVAASVTGVPDPTTLELSDGARLRLAGVVAADGALGEAARRRLSELTAGRSIIYVDVSDALDRYGRRAGYVFAGGTMLQEALVRDGLARAVWFPGEGDCLKRFLDAEKAPRGAKTGLWAGGGTFRATDPALADNAGRPVVVIGRVVSVNHGDRVVFVDFGRNYRTDFTVLIAPAIASQMAEEGRPVETLVGKEVEVRGMMEKSGGPAVRLNDPAEITINRDDG